MKTKQIFLISASTVILFASGCTRIASKTGPLTPYPEITSDIEIGEEVRGEGTRAELLGFIRWGDPGRATFRSHMQEHQAGGILGTADALGGGVVKQSMQSAVFKALEGEPDNFIVDPHFHVVEHNFLVFRTATSKVVGRRAKHTNYRQVKRFNSDKTETLLLGNSPQTYTVHRNGSEATKITTSGNITPHVSNTANVVDTSSGVHTIGMGVGSSARKSLNELESNIQALKVKLDAVNSSSNGTQTASWRK